MKRFYGTHHDQIARMKQLEESQKNSEARERLRELKKLKDQNHFDILFFNTQIEYSKTIELTKEEKSELNSLIIKATK